LLLRTDRITNGNRSGGDFAPPPGCEKPQSATPFCGFVSATFWQPCKRKSGVRMLFYAFALA